MSGSITQQFDVFAQVVASGNIAATANALKLPVASVIAAMNGLEDRLGLQLFTITDGAVALTQGGQKAVFALAELSVEAQEDWINALVDEPGHGSASGYIEKREPRSKVSPDEKPLANKMRDTQAAAENDMSDLSVTERRTANANTIIAQGDEAPSASTSQPSPRHFRPHDPKKPKPAPEPVQTITLASDPSIFSHFQEELIAFEQASPDIGITLRLTGLDTDQLTTLFKEKTADIGYFYTLDDKDAFNSRYAWSERISFFTGRERKLAKLDSAMAEDLSSIPYVALAPDNITRTLAEATLAQHGFQVGEPVLETDNLYDIMKYLLKNESYFLAFGAMARDFGKMGGIARIAYAQGLPQVHVRQAVRPDLAKDPAVLALAEFLFR